MFYSGPGGNKQGIRSNPLIRSRRKIGANAQYFERDPAKAVDNGALKKMDDTFKGIFELNKENELDIAVSKSKIIGVLRGILKIEELTSLRHCLIEKAKQ